MALKLLKSKLMPIGLDLGWSSLKMVQLRHSEQDSLELVAANCSQVPMPLRQDLRARLEFLSEEIRGLLKSGGFQGRRCILSLPAHHTFLGHVKMPRLSDAELTKALRMELHGKLPYSVNDAVIRHVVAGDTYDAGEGKQEVIVAAVERKVLEAYLDVVHRVKLDVVGVNVESAAVVECFGRLFRGESDTARTILFIDLGASSTQVVLTHGDRLVFARNLNYGEHQIDEAIAKGMSVPIEQAHLLRWDLAKANLGGPAEDELYRYVENQLNSLADEVTQCLRYYESVFRNQTVERAIFVGGQAYDKRLCQALAQRLNLPAQIGDPLVRIQKQEGWTAPGGSDKPEPQPHWAVAVGLSLGSVRAA